MTRAVALLLLLAACARVQPKPDLWSICRDACAIHGAEVAAVIGSTTTMAPPGCMCAGPKEAT